jgi:hypothetical protein
VASPLVSISVGGPRSVYLGGMDCMRAAVPAALVKVPNDCLFIDSRADTDFFLSLQFESCTAHYSRRSLCISSFILATMG